MSEPSLILECAGCLLALPAGRVREVIRAVKVTTFPHTPPAIAGVINLRGTTTAVINLRALLEMPGVPLHPSQYFVILNEEEPVALIVDKVHDLALLSDEQKSSLVDSVTSTRLIRQIAHSAEGMVLLLNADFITRVLEGQNLPDVTLPGRLE